MNRQLKRAVERALLLAGVPALARRASRTRAVVLMYHNVVPDGAQPGGDRSLHLGRREFAAQLDFLGRACDVVPLDGLIEGRPVATGRIRVAITFDDAYEGAATIGVDELAKRGMPATIFVPPALLGRHTWWDVVANKTGGEIPATVRGDLLTRLGGREALTLAHMNGDGKGEREAGTAVSTAENGLPNLRIAKFDQLVQVSKRPGITVGSHTWTHPNLATASPDDLRAELVRPLEWLRERIASYVPFVTYPYGLSSPRVEKEAQQAGYSAAFLAGGGWLPSDPAQARFALPRFNIPAGLSADGFRLRLSGFGIR